MDTLYSDLGVEPDADPATLQRAYRDAAKRTHPDAGGDREAFERVNRAWMVLRDPDKRERYDRTGSAENEPDNALGMMASMMGNLLDKALAQVLGDFQHYDLVKLMLEDARDQLAHVKGEIAKGKKALERHDQMLERARYKGDGANLLERILKDRRRSDADQILSLEKSREGWGGLVKLLADYEWRIDEPEQMDLEAVLGRHFVNGIGPPTPFGSSEPRAASASA